MALISHLDLMRLFDRALRRASLPISFTGGFHPGPRVSAANALSLGITSTGEVVDFELKQAMDPLEFQQRLAAQLPGEIPLYSVAEVPLHTPSATKLLERAEYYLRLTPGPELTASSLPWQDWVNQVLALDSLPWEKLSKSGKPQVIDLRSQLQELAVVDPQDQTLPVPQLQSQDREGVVRWVGSCRNDGNLLRPDQVLWMLRQVGAESLEIRHSHRSRLMLSDP